MTSTPFDCPNDLAEHTSATSCTCRTEPYDYHDCGNPRCAADGAELPPPPTGHSSDQTVDYVRGFHTDP